MSADPAASFLAAAEAAQAGAGIIAARHRGDLGSADTLLDGLSDARKAAGFLFLADLAITLLARYEDRPVDAVAAELSLHIATESPRTGDDEP
jgi:Fe-Mn family superoxide dismutase